MITGMSLDYFDFFQLGFVTDDIEAGMETLRRAYGIPEFWVGRGGTVMSAEGAAEVDGALAYVGNIQIELLAPRGGKDRVYRDLVPSEHGAVRFHHCGHLVPDRSTWDRMIASVTASGLATPLRGEYEGMAHYLYVDTCAALGHYTEFILLTEKGNGLFANVPRYER